MGELKYREPTQEERDLYYNNQVLLQADNIARLAQNCIDLERELKALKTLLKWAKRVHKRAYRSLKTKNDFVALDEILNKITNKKPPSR